MQKPKRPLYIVVHPGQLGFVYGSYPRTVTFTQRRSEARRYSVRVAKQVASRIGGVVELADRGQGE